MNRPGASEAASVPSITLYLLNANFIFDSAIGRCDAKRAKNAALSLLPVIGWMRMYQVKEWLLGDIVSGVSTGLVAVLQGKRHIDSDSVFPHVTGKYGKQKVQIYVRHYLTEESFSSVCLSNISYV